MRQLVDAEKECPVWVVFTFARSKLTLKTDVPDGIEQGERKMKKIVRKVLYSFAILFIMVACGKPPVAPSGLSMDKSGSSYFLSWNEVSNATYYWIECDGRDGGGTSLTYYEYYSLDEGDHAFRVKAENEYGESPYSSFYHYTVSNTNGGGGNGGGSGSDLPAPTGVSAEVSGSRVCVTWNSVSNASKYRVYRSSSSSGTYSMLDYTTNTYYYDSSPNTENYYKVTAVNSNGDESEKSSYAYCYYSSGGGGGGSGSAPSAPYSVEATVIGSRIKVSWNSVSNATSYTVYWSRDNSSYSYTIGSTSNTYIYDDAPEQNNYYKVKAENSYGASPLSTWAYCYYAGGGGGSTVYSPCPVNYTSHTATSTTITLKWTNPTTTGCGTPTTAYLRVRNPDSGVYADLQTLSGTATTASFSYGMWANSDGYVYCGIITENSAGTSGGSPLVYNWRTNTWYGGKGLELTEEMKNVWVGF